MGDTKLKNLISISIIAFMIAGVFALPVINDDYSVQAATKKVKVIYKANGGKFTAAKYASKSKVVKKVRKGKKRGTAPKIKRTGYILKGWYTKKSGGKKVTAKTKIKKKTTLYAQWKKVPNPNIDTKLLGLWAHTDYYVYPRIYYDYQDYIFYKDGTFKYINVDGPVKSGKYKASGGKVTFTNVTWVDSAGVYQGIYPDTVVEYRYKIENGKTYLEMPKLDYKDKNYLDISMRVEWYR